MKIHDRATLVLSAALLCAPLVGCGPSTGGGGTTGGTTGGGGGTSGGSSANVNTGHVTTGGPTASAGGSGSIALPTIAADGSIVIGPGFTPSPIIMGGSAGGSVDASTMMGAGTMAYGYSCIGMMPTTPQHVLEVTGPIPHLRIVVDTYIAGTGGSNDTTLMVRMPDGSFWCDDDGGGELQPMVEGMVTMPGRVEVFVGGYSSSGVGARYKIAFTESYDYTHYSIRGTAPPAYTY
jgi:hypothetical protein